MALAWLAVRMTDGAILDDVTAFEPDWPLRDTLTNYDTLTGSYYLDEALEVDENGVVINDWRSTIKAGATVLACYEEDDETRSIQWAGYVTSTDPDTTKGAVALSLATIAAYWTRRYVPDVTYAGTLGRNAVIADLISYAQPRPGLPGVPFVVTQVGGAGPLLGSDRVLQNTDNATVADRIGSLISEFGGEYAVLWERGTGAGGREVLVPHVYVGDSIGSVTSTGRPSVTLEMPGAISSLSMPTDYGDGAGANHVTPYSSGQGDLVPYGSPVIAADFQGRPVYEYRYQPVASETDLAVLTAHARQAFTVVNPGAQPLALTLAAELLDGDERYGVGWRLGSHLGYVVEACPEFPDGLEGTARAIAVERDQTTITPVFAQPEIYTDADSAEGGA